MLILSGTVSAAEPSSQPQPQAAAASRVLPSGSDLAFRSGMLDWTPPPADRSLVTIERVGGGERATVQLQRLRISSPFGWRSDPLRGGKRRHAGIDLPGPAGARVLATGDGIVRVAGWAGGYGRLIELDHGNGVSTRYGHLASVHVAPGQRVATGQVIGGMGSTGRSTGTHLHYEVRLNGLPVDPLLAASTAHIPASEFKTIWGTEAKVAPRWQGWATDTSSALPEARIR
ncbi:M23 family metallopeptidase [Sphingomonas sp. GCM10030256]|uniref:M23 family metallopeptidase n=1 Tax=Sphingomonas sp. GCM10030256 TaxID=3273427 RepID=UPI003620F69D